MDFLSKLILFLLPVFDELIEDELWSDIKEYLLFVLLALFFEECGVSLSSSLFRFVNFESVLHFFLCLLKASDLLNFLWQYSHSKGFSSKFINELYFYNIITN